MRNRRLGSFIAISILSAISLYAAQPLNPSSALSDGFYNTAMGMAVQAKAIEDLKTQVSELNVLTQELRATQQRQGL